MRSTDIEELRHLGLDAFQQVYRGVRPVVLRGFVGGSRPCRQWSPGYLVERLGDRTVALHSCERQLDHTVQGAVEALSRPATMTLREAAARILGASDVLHYLHGQPIRRQFPELLEELDFDDLVSSVKPLHDVNLWFASAGHVTPLHYDKTDNFLNQIVGSKRLTLFAPSDKEHLYPPTESAAPGLDTIDLFDPDEEQKARLERTTPIRLVLHPGDTLYLPAHWSHHVESLDVTISVNYFFG